MMTVLISAASPAVSSSVWTTTAVSPDVVTIGLPADSTPASATASRSSSAVSWVTSDASSETVIWVPPVNSMP